MHQDNLTSCELNTIGGQIELLNENYNEMQLDLTRIKGQIQIEEFKKSFKTIQDIKQLDLIIAKQGIKLLNIKDKVNTLTKQITLKDNQDEYQDQRLNKQDVAMNDHE